MLASSPSSINGSKVLRIISITLAAWMLGTATFSVAAENLRVRRIGHIDSVIAPRILKQVRIVPLSLQHDSPILLQGETSSLARASNTSNAAKAFGSSGTSIAARLNRRFAGSTRRSPHS
jgi:hypothetical protein